jgi:hypothetical protein
MNEIIILEDINRFEYKKGCSDSNGENGLEEGEVERLRISSAS